MAFQKIIPKFLKRLDHYLLINAPILWQSRIHFVFFAVLATNLIFAFLSWLMPVGLTDDHDINSWIWTFFVVAITYLIIWFIHTGRFNLFKQYGKRPLGDEYINFLLNFICVTLIASTIFSFPFFYQLKIKNLVSDKELARDVNTLNLGAPFFPNSGYNYKTRDNDLNSSIEQHKAYLYNYNGFNRFSYRSILNLLEPNDSFKNYLNVPHDQNYYYEGGYIGRSCPWDSTSIGLYCEGYSKALFNKLKSKKEQLRLINELIATSEKYGVDVPQNAEYYLSVFNPSDNYSVDLKSLVYKDYQFLSNIERKIGLFVQYKTDDQFYEDEDFLHFMWYLLFYTTLVFMIYRNVRRRDFILTIVSGIVIMVLSAIFLGITRTFNEEQVFGLYFFIFAILCIIGFSVFMAKSHTWMYASALNLVIISIPFMPVYFYEVFDMGKNSLAYRAELLGFVIFFLLLQIVFKKLYSILWSLPDK
jgi:hypothetical protein